MIDNAVIAANLKALYDVNKTKSNKNLIDDRGKLFVQFTVKVVPPNKKSGFKHFVFPNDFRHPDSEFCLIVKDINKNSRDFGESISQYQELFKTKKLLDVKGPSEIITYRQLSSEFSTFELRRNLCNSYDYFLYDDRLSNIISRKLGKCFYSSPSKLPISVNLSNSGKMLRTIVKARKTVLLSLKGLGSCLSLCFGHIDLERELVEHNLRYAIDSFVNEYAGNISNISSIYIKSQISMSIPLFVSMSPPKNVEFLPNEKKNIEFGDFEEISTRGNLQVKITSDLDIIVKNQKMHNQSPSVKRRKTKRSARKSKKQEHISRNENSKNRLLNVNKFKKRYFKKLK